MEMTTHEKEIQKHVRVDPNRSELLYTENDFAEMAAVGNGAEKEMAARDRPLTYGWCA